MLKNFALWFITFGLSFLVSEVFGWTDQGRAFLYIYLGVGVIIILAFTIIIAVKGFTKEAFIVIAFMAVRIAVMLFATWGATKLFGVDFFVAYQIMTFGQCLCEEKKKEIKV